MNEHIMKRIQEMPEAMQNLTLGDLAYNSSEAGYVLDFLEANGVVILPCKAGDIVYKLDYAPCHEGETYPDSLMSDGCEGPCDLKRVVKEVKMHNIQDIWSAFCKLPSQKIYFVTKEEAEKYL